MKAEIIEIVGLSLWLLPVIVYYIVMPVVSGIRKVVAP